MSPANPESSVDRDQAKGSNSETIDDDESVSKDPPRETQTGLRDPMAVASPLQTRATNVFRIGGRKPTEESTMAVTAEEESKTQSSDMTTRGWAPAATKDLSIGGKHDNSAGGQRLGFTFPLHDRHAAAPAQHAQSTMNDTSQAGRMGPAVEPTDTEKVERRRRALKRQTEEEEERMQKQAQRKKRRF